MFRTLDRYVIREILPPLFLSLLIFTFILEIPPVMEQLESLVAKGVSWDIAARMLLTLIPQGLGLTIPMSLLVGLLVGLGRLSNDREAVALLACGVSPYRLLRPVLLLALMAAGADFYVMVWGIPNANQAFREITYSVISKRMENDIRPQVFFEDFPNWVLYVRDTPPGGGWKDVFIADTHDAEHPAVFMADHGRLRLDRAARTVALELYDGTRYSTTGPSGRQIDTFRFSQQLVKLDPQAVFPRMDQVLQRGLNEMSIADLRRQAVERAKTGASPHPEVMAVQQKFSFPVACGVFALIGLALGLTVAREGKMTGFVVGLAVIFVYYMLLAFSESLTKGQHLNMYLSRWVPNLVLLPFGIVALIWRARWAEGRLPFASVQRVADRVNLWLRERMARAETGGGIAGGGGLIRSGAASGKRPVVVIRIPRLSWLSPNILDRYVTRLYVRTAALAFVGLLGIFYISTFIDKSEKLFKGQASGAMITQLLAYMTPQFVFYVIPLAALLSVLVTFGVLSRTNELTVMKACGVSLYRIAMPLILMALLGSVMLFALEQRVMAKANQRAEALDAQVRNRPARTMNPLARRWLVSKTGAFYHYNGFEPGRNAILDLTIYRPDDDAWELGSETFARRATFTSGRWVGENGWRQEFLPKSEWSAFSSRPLTIETPDYFETAQPIAEMMTVTELRDHIRELASSGVNVVPDIVDLQRKLAFPFVTLVMTLLAIPFGITMGRSGTLYGIGIGIVLALSYWVLGSAFVAIGKAGLLGPVLAAWAPNIIGAGAAGYLLLTART
jgi:LPS export ABC transporter permease LptG/LPS export ABC transporter permease LptF